MRAILSILLVLILIGSAGWVWSGGNVSYFADGAKPEITFVRSGGDSRRTSFSLKSSDVGSGITKVRTVVNQNGKETEVLNESFQEPESAIERSFEIEPKTLGLAEGVATVTTTIVDASFSQNEASSNVEINLDYTPPTVSVVSRQFTANQGGAEFILYRVGGGAYLRTGVKITGPTFGELFFRGVPGSAFDPRLAAHPEIHAALLALPLGWNGATDRITVIVEDAGGNIAKSGLEFPVQQTKQVDVNSKLSLSFLERKIPELIVSYENRSNERVDQSDMSPDAQVARFRTINETYRAQLKREMFALIDKSAPTKLWNGVFSRPIPGSTTSLFGERRSYGLDGKSAGGSLHEGLDLASVQNDVVRSVNDGVVVFAGEFGIYGQTVIVDHGTGLFSLYGHLSSIAVESGAKVSKDTELARTGTTGLAGGDHLHFEFRVGHVSVNPIEWWDAKWIADNIDGKINEFLTDFGGKIG